MCARARVCVSVIDKFITAQERGEGGEEKKEVGGGGGEGDKKRVGVERVRYRGNWSQKPEHITSKDEILE